MDFFFPLLMDVLSVAVDAGEKSIRRQYLFRRIVMSGSTEFANGKMTFSRSKGLYPETGHIGGVNVPSSAETVRHTGEFGGKARIEFAGSLMVEFETQFSGFARPDRASSQKLIVHIERNAAEAVFPVVDGFAFQIAVSGKIPAGPVFRFQPETDPRQIPCRGDLNVATV